MNKGRRNGNSPWRPLNVLDLFCGLGGFSAAFRDRGHRVTGIDILLSVKPTICADIRMLPLNPSVRFDVVLASPPCTEFSKASMPWHRDSARPSTDLLVATLGVIESIKPQYWAVENVRGAVPFFRPYLGEYRARFGSRYLWGNFPLFRVPYNECYGKWRLAPTEQRALLRSVVPYPISEGLCLAIEEELFD